MVIKFGQFEWIGCEVFNTFCFMFKENGTGTCLVSDGADLPKDFQTIVDEVKKNRSLGGNQITVAPGTCN